tara:strand:+ start:366 stop:563 length:198 start_codon:yes stop_codon:yes gene_type:complete
MEGGFGHRSFSESETTRESGETFRFDFSVKRILSVTKNIFQKITKIFTIKTQKDIEASIHKDRKS